MTGPPTLDELLELTRACWRSAGITRLAEITGLDVLGVPVCTVARPNARSSAVSQGRGTSLSAAKVSAVMEALETAAAETARPLLRLGTAAELGAAGASCVDVDLLPRLPGTPAPSARSLLWCAGATLPGGDRCWVPFDVVHLDWTLPPLAGSTVFAQSSNGLASGVDADAATLAALAELVERDAASLHWAADPPARAARRVEPASITDAESRALLERWSTAGVLVGIWDLTCDTRLPVVLATLVDADDEVFRPLPAGMGLGAAPSADTALIRALTEAAQSRLVTIAGARDDQDAADYARLFDRAAIAAVRSELLAVHGLQSWPGTAAVAASGAPDVGELAARVAGCTGRPPVRVELTPDGWPVHVVRVVAPGLEAMAAAMGSAAVPGHRAARAAGQAAR